MCKLVKAESWLSETFEKDSEPSLQEVADWVEKNIVPGRILGTDTYIYAQAFALGKSAPYDLNTAPLKVTADSLLS